MQTALTSIFFCRLMTSLRNKESENLIPNSVYCRRLEQLLIGFAQGFFAVYMLSYLFLTSFPLSHSRCVRLQSYPRTSGREVISIHRRSTHTYRMPACTVLSAATDVLVQGWSSKSIWHSGHGKMALPSYSMDVIEYSHDLAPRLKRARRIASQYLQSSRIRM